MPTPMGPGGFLVRVICETIMPKEVQNADQLVEQVKTTVKEQVSELNK